MLASRIRWDYRLGRRESATRESPRGLSRQKPQRQSGRHAPYGNSGLPWSSPMTRVVQIRWRVLGAPVKIAGTDDPLIIDFLRIGALVQRKLAEFSLKSALMLEKAEGRLTASALHCRRPRARQPLKAPRAPQDAARGGTDDSRTRSQAGSTGLTAPRRTRPMPAAPVRKPRSSTQPSSGVRLVISPIGRQACQPAIPWPGRRRAIRRSIQASASAFQKGSPVAWKRRL